MDRYERNVDRLYKSGAFKTNFDTPFTLTSGLLSPYYLQCAELQNHPDSYKGALEDLKELILETVDISDFDRVAGGEMRDFIFSIPLAVNYLGKPHTMIRKKASTHGTGGNLITTINPGERVILTPDLRTTGKSEIEYWIPAIRGAGGIIDHSFAYVDRQQNGVEALSELDPPVKGHCIIPMDIEKFFDIGLDAGHINTTQYSDLKEYLSDPQKWSELHRKS